VILVDTSVWIDHFREPDSLLSELIEDQRVLIHPLVIGELAMGDLTPRDATLHRLSRLEPAHMARHADVLRLVQTQRLYAIGLAFVDAHLLASARITPDSSLWTRDKRLRAAAERLDLAADLQGS